MPKMKLTTIIEYQRKYESILTSLYNTSLPTNCHDSYLHPKYLLIRAFSTLNVPYSIAAVRDAIIYIIPLFCKTATSRIRGVITILHTLLITPVNIPERCTNDGLKS
mmetsp:Transcript_10136/g.17789  ORF Transcript_10136/g.17789 Transcript_10136/m.17789 type:complete len:107 (+) Transcript_10136:200-520(+)